MKTFGQYLVEQNAIDKNQLTKAYVFQESQTPRLLESLESLGSVNADKLLELVSQSILEQENLYAVIKNDPSIDLEEVTAHIKEKTPSLGQCLVEMGFCEADFLKNEFEKFQSLDQDSSDNQSIENKSPNLEDKESTPKLSPAALESMKELGMDISEFELDEPEVNEVVNNEPEEYDLEYLNFFNHDRLEKIRDVLRKIDEQVQENGDYQNYLTSLFQEFHLIKGAATLDDLKISGKLLGQAEQKISDIIESKEQAASFFDSTKEILSGALEISWEIRSFLKDGKKEIDYWHEEASKKAYLETMRLLSSLPKAA